MDVGCCPGLSAHSAVRLVQSPIGRGVDGYLVLLVTMGRRVHEESHGMGRVVADSARTRPGPQGSPRWALIAGILALLLCGCSVAPMPIYDSLPAQPGARGSAAPLPAQSATAPASRHARHAAKA